MNEYMMSQANSVTFTYVFGMAMGDEMPLPLMVAAISAGMFLALARSAEEKELACLLIPEEQDQKDTRTVDTEIHLPAEADLSNASEEQVEECLRNYLNASHEMG